MKDFVTIRVPKSAAEKLPRAVAELARDRTAFLLARVQWMPLTDLLANAWVQGIRDCAQATGQMQETGAAVPAHNEGESG